MIHISALHGNLILAAIGQIAVQHPHASAIGSMSYGQLASNILDSASNLLSASLPEGMLGGYDLEEEMVTMPGLGMDAKVVGLLATWAAGGVGTSIDHPEGSGGSDLPLVLYDPSTSSSNETHQPYRLADLELADAPPRREGDDTVYVDNSQIAAWLAELELTNLERKAYVIDGSIQGVDNQEAQVPIKVKPTTLTHGQVASLIFGIVNEDPSPEQFQLSPKDLALFQSIARLLQQPGATK